MKIKEAQPACWNQVAESAGRIQWDNTAEKHGGPVSTLVKPVAQDKVLAEPVDVLFSTGFLREFAPA